jgi:tRNA threonylcarbamoyladenosine biosynthesis protein TsaB
MLLAIETASARGSIALIDATGKTEFTALPDERNHGRTLAQTVKDLLDGREDQLEAYGLSIGPGSFTGLRIGLAFLKGFAIVYPHPVVAISTLKILAMGCAPDALKRPVLAMTDARSNEIYAGLYTPGATRTLQNDPLLVDGLYEREKLFAQFESSALFVVGDGSYASKTGQEPPVIPNTWTLCDPELCVPRADVLARLSWSEFQAGVTVSVADLEPQYHQLSAAERKFG